MSSLEKGVRSFSKARIEDDLLLLMERGVQTVKLVDRTFNFDPDRANSIWEFILRNNRSTRFHFEIAADLLYREQSPPPGAGTGRAVPVRDRRPVGGRRNPRPVSAGAPILRGCSQTCGGWSKRPALRFISTWWQDFPMRTTKVFFAHCSRFSSSCSRQRRMTPSPAAHSFRSNR